MAQSSYQAQAYARVWQVQQLLHPKPSDLISAARFFVREGELAMWNQKKRKKSKRYFFLFNDIMLLTKRQSSKKYLLRIHITLRSPSVSIEMIDSASYNWEFRLHCRTRSFILYAAGEEDRTLWFTEIEKSIKGTHPDEKKAIEEGKPNEGLSKASSNNPRASIVVVPKKAKSEKKTKTGGDDSARNRSASELPKKSASTAGKTLSIQQQPGLMRSSPGVIQNETNAFVTPTPLENNPQTGIFLYQNPMLTNNPFMDVPAVTQNPFATNSFATAANPYATGASPFAPSANRMSVALAPGTTFTGSQPGQPSNPFATNPTAFTGSQPGQPANPFATTPARVASNPNPFATNPAPFTASNPGAPVNPFATTPNPYLGSNPGTNPYAAKPNLALQPSPFGAPNTTANFF